MFARDILTWHFHVSGDKPNLKINWAKTHLPQTVRALDSPVMSTNHLGIIKPHLIKAPFLISEEPLNSWEDKQPNKTGIIPKMPGMFGQNTKNARKFCEIPKMPGCFRKYQKCPGRSDKAWSWHMLGRFIKITHRKETCRRGSSPKRHKQRTINWVLFRVMFQTKTSRSLQNITGWQNVTKRRGTAWRLKSQWWDWGVNVNDRRL